jgi:hypothetical protein
MHVNDMEILAAMRAKLYLLLINLKQLTLSQQFKRLNTRYLLHYKKLLQILENLCACTV